MKRFSVAAFAGSALAATATVGAASSAGRRNTVKNHKVRRGDPGTEALLKNARPYKKKGVNSSAGASSHTKERRLDENNFEVDGTYNLKFSQCVDMKLFDEDLFDEDVVEYTKAGQIISTQSYALFHVCQDDDCYYESEDDLYIVDLATYVMNVASYHANIKASYCDACDTYSYDYCVAEQQQDDAAAAAGDDYVVADDAAAAGDDAAAAYYEGDDAARRLEKKTQRRTTQYIDCDQCEAYGCLNNGDDDANANRRLDGDGDDSVVELIEDISQCLNTGLNWNDNDLYIGFMCSPYDGDGVELAVFLDNQCTVYTSLKSFSDIPTWYIYNDEDVFAEAETYIKNSFTETIPCLDEQFGNPAYQPGDDDQAAANDDGYAVNDYCTGIFQEGALAFNSNSCAQNDDQNNGNNDDQDLDDQMKFYDYDMNYDDARDLDTVCYVLQQMEGEYYYHYDKENSGTWNDHSGWGGGNNKKKGRWGYLGGQLKDSSFTTSGIAIFLYVMLGVSMIISVLFVVGVHEKKKREKAASMYMGGRLV